MQNKPLSIMAMSVLLCSSMPTYSSWKILNKPKQWYTYCYWHYKITQLSAKKQQHGWLLKDLQTSLTQKEPIDYDARYCWDILLQAKNTTDKNKKIQALSTLIQQYKNSASHNQTYAHLVAYSTKYALPNYALVKSLLKKARKTPLSPILDNRSILIGSTLIDAATIYLATVYFKNKMGPIQLPTPQPNPTGSYKQTAPKEKTRTEQDTAPHTQLNHQGQVVSPNTAENDQQNRTAYACQAMKAEQVSQEIQTDQQTTEYKNQATQTIETRHVSWTTPTDLQEPVTTSIIASPLITHRQKRGETLQNKRHPSLIKITNSITWPDLRITQGICPSTFEIKINGKLIETNQPKTSGRFKRNVITIDAQEQITITYEYKIEAPWGWYTKKEEMQYSIPSENKDLTIRFLSWVEKSQIIIDGAEKISGKTIFENSPPVPRKYLKMLERMPKEIQKALTTET